MRRRPRTGACSVCDRSLPRTAEGRKNWLFSRKSGKWTCPGCLRAAARMKSGREEGAIQ